ncbi:aminotransferase class III-fold pyridoxal phosphate-dependent enzyme [Falsigemmobacter faecalis]|uniref:Aminotransferase class III-fold pyridoxal phosphate-dependent enzyme n=1 Tax=Falsigemmobacter faecalis TaxID=2488730 RepID=A0A3P3DRG2_9RHOB|nr:aminotransferase class III-fold pyridoxal phosphate-dependent enzyme [Falsigemmobacter faecalis]RRH76132.1 aminotransferase class III-fold pyridoxal phosphate-dependent enzyme [Falsigemmobacter faecalis]
MTPAPQHSLTPDQDLRQRAARVIPGGLWGHQRAAAVPRGYPQFFKGGKGARVTDANGQSYIDFMCAWGPMVLGYGNEVVDRAALGQIAMGDSLNGPTPHLVELAELMVETIPHADWAMFQKNGTDATTACVTIARATTQKRKVLVARGAYHGAAPWCTPSLLGVTSEDRAHLLHYDYNDAESLKAAVAEAGEDLAAVIVSAFKHDLGKVQSAPDRDFATAARALCDATGAALIVDDVRAGFRLNLGGTWEEVGVRADLSAWSKAIANGYPLSAVTGAERFREAAAQIYVTGSFWYGGTPMAAAVATIRELHRLNGPALMKASGEAFRQGLSEQAARHGFEVDLSGPAAMPLMKFAGDDELSTLGEQFCQQALAEGVYLHHRHNMFLSTAHDAAVIAEALERTEKAFTALAQNRRT